MRLFLTFILFLFKIASFSQSFGIEYLVSTEGKDPNLQSLLIFSKDGNTFSRYKRLSDNISWYRNLRLKKYPKIDYQIFDSTYLEIADEQLAEYEVTVCGNEIIDKTNCLKISVVTYKAGDKVTMWVTNELPSYQTYMDCYVNTIDLRKLNHALNKINHPGFPIKIVYNEKSPQVYEFVNGKVEPLEDSLFSLENFKKGELRSSDDLKQNNQISEEQYRLMKVEEEKAKKQSKEK